MIEKKEFKEFKNMVLDHFSEIESVFTTEQQNFDIIEEIHKFVHSIGFDSEFLSHLKKLSIQKEQAIYQNFLRDTHKFFDIN